MTTLTGAVIEIVVGGTVIIYGEGSTPVITQQINQETTTTPSNKAVFDAFALKADTIDSSGNKVVYATDGIIISQSPGQDTDKAPSLKLFTDTVEAQNSAIESGIEDIQNAFADKSAEIDQKIADVEEDLSKQVAKKADNVIITTDNKLQLTSEGNPIGSAIELPAGIVNVSGKSATSYATATAARAAVKIADRVTGQVIVYRLADGAWYLDQFVGDSISSWENEGSWRSFITVSDLTQIVTDVTALGIEVTGIKQAVSTKADNGYTFEEDDVTYLQLTNNGEDVGDRIALPAGGGGGGSGSGITMRVRVVGATNMVIGEDINAFVKYSFTSVESDTGIDTGDGDYVVLVNGATVSSGKAIQGENQFNLKGYVYLGSNTVKIRVTDSYGNARTVTWNVQVASLVLTSTFADDIIYNTNPVQFRYTPVGLGTKTVRFFLDGNELPSDTVDTSGRQITKNLTGIGNGMHSIRVFAESTVEGSSLKSNELYYEFIYADASVTKPIISVSYNQTEVEQFSMIDIPFMVYDPKNEPAHVTVRANNVIVATMDVPRTKQHFTYQANTEGTLSILFTVGATSRVININVTPSSLDIREETADLEFKVNALGKSNSNSDRDKWDNNGYTSTFGGFSWVSDGWQKDDDNNSCLKLIGDSKVDINIKPFSNNILTTGMTLTVEYSTEEVSSDTAVVMSTLFQGIGVEFTPTSVTLTSAQSNISARYDSSSKKISVSLVVQKLAESRLVYLLVDGIASGVLQYPNGDNFTQPTGQNFILSTGNRACQLQVYGIRWYKNSLNFEQVLGNYIFDIESLREKQAVNARNQIMDVYGNIDYNKALEFLPCMTFTGELPNYKGDKKPVDIVYENKQDPSKSFTSAGAQNDVQGTSSQFYPRKNWKFKFKNGFTYSESGVNENEYPLGDGMKASVFCLKADFAESSGTHNTGIAILLDEMLKEYGILTPPQRENRSVRTTIYGFPILLFHKTNASSSAEFVGKYNFNYDKAAESVFGFKEGNECWEFRNNTSPLCLFKSADFDSLITDDKGRQVPVWTTALEGRYPDEGSDISNIKPLWQWVVSCIGNPDKFKAECKEHFDVQNLLFTFINVEALTRTDQAAKNQFITTYGEKGSTGKLLWRFIDYDNDTALGINNEGLIAYSPYVEFEDVVNSGHVWNGWDSELWRLVRAAYKDELKKVYQELRQKQLLSPAKVLDILQKHQADKWAELVYNKDGQFKYIFPLTEGYYDYSSGSPVLTKTGAYLYALQGSRTRYRGWYVKERFNYMDSKYDAGSHINDTATMRLYTPDVWTGVQPNADFNVSPAKPTYVRAMYGSIKTEGIRGEANKTYKITAPTGIQFNDTETIVYGASSLKSLGDLSAKYIGTVDISKAVALEDLIVGSNVAGYKNENLTTLHIGENARLKKVNLVGCPNLKESLDFSKCYSLEEIDARGSGVTGMSLPSSGVLTKAQLPASFAALILRNQPYLTTLSMEGYANLNTIVIENVPDIDGYNLVKSCINIANNKLSKVRLININTSDTNSKVLNALSLMTGEDENGRPTDTAVVTGKIIINQISQDALDYLKRVFPNLQIDYNEILDVINIVDPIMSKIAVDKWDTNGDGQLSANEVALETIPSNLLQGTGVKTFNEAHFWKGNNSIIDNCDTLESVAIRTGNSTIKNLPDLKTIYIYQGKEDSLIADPLLITQTSLTNAYMIENWNLVKETADFRYIIGKNGGSILGKINSNLGQYYKLCYPWRDRSSLTIYEPLFFDDVINKTYPWLNLLQTVNLQNCVGLNLLYNTTIKIFNIKGIGWANGEGAGISLGNGGSIVNEINISNGKLAYLRIGVGGNNNRYQSIKIADDVYADEGTNIGWSNYNGGNYDTANSISLLDLGKNIKGNICCYNWTAADYCGRIKKLIIRNTEKVLPLIIIWTNYTYAVCDEVYVPDNLYDAYKTENNWSKFPNVIKKISMLS